jgi:transposase
MLSAAQIEQLPDEVKDHIAGLTHQYESRISQAELEIEDLQEQLKLARFRKFARSSESAEELLQAMLFEEAEIQSVPPDEPETDRSLTTVASHTRKKRGRKPLSDDLPTVEVIHDIPEAQKRCACGHELSKVDEEVSEKLKTIPEQFFVERHIRPKYACRNCEGSGDEENPVFRIASVPPSIIPKSIVTPELLAFIIQNKFVDHLPYYRQEKRFERLGARISRQDMSNWQQKAYIALKPLKDLLKEQLLSGPVIQMDETTVQVMNEPEKSNTSTSYMWLARGGPPGKPVVDYAYHRSRGSEYAKAYLSDFSGYLQTDGYVGYETALKDRSDIIHVGCMAHVRRKFFEAGKSSKKAGSAHQAVSKIAEFYRIEKELRSQDLSDDEFTRKRKARIAPVADRFKAWLDKKALSVRPSSAVGRAVTYALSQWDKVMKYIESPYLTPDNNGAENAIRPFVLGRKNWLFSGSPEGAEGSCFMFSLIETARQNGLNPYGYLVHVFTKAPEIGESGNWEDLLPWNIKDDLLELKSILN